ncbi:MAG: zinc ribbon domain-containing protein [Deltaproteobacteria bacterium]|nr:zinc ribbon domain-containing protein [Deltaproteobacteria bacterium]
MKKERVKEESNQGKIDVPIYEYRCNQCEREFSQLFLNSREIRKVKCKLCGGNDLKRLISIFSVHQTEESRLASLDTSKPKGDDFYKDSRNVGLWAKKRMKEMGVDLGPKMDEIVERGRTGKILEDYDK